MHRKSEKKIKSRYTVARGIRLLQNILNAIMEVPI